MSRPRVTIDAAVLAPAIWVQACFEAHIGTVVPSDDRFRSVAKILRLVPRLFVRGRINIDTINVSQVNMQFFESIGRTPGGASPAKGRIALGCLLDDRPELVFRRHLLRSHEHIVMSSESFNFLLYLRTDYYSLNTDHFFSRRGGRAVDCAGLENRKAER